MKNRTHFTHRIDMSVDDGENLIEHLASVEDFEVAMATYRAARQRWPGAALVILISNARGPECENRFTLMLCVPGSGSLGIDVLGMACQVPLVGTAEGGGVDTNITASPLAAAA